ncbi:hypothetical protein K1T71_005170 [Dendrolimus kikuchii]|uniref:Uncharacterized protein n=2 Tax=Dendrolimus kikuchii TaxID=765133 RepID=A0ACC1CF52_9NEOP|nr:hypothetical protein K1T71_014135 [Dendrolimus kikuchii]KAJ0179458.1 hypothetical protein K1T71_005170 [Dendrolimus kikuchii]
MLRRFGKGVGCCDGCRCVRRCCWWVAAAVVGACVGRLLRRLSVRGLYAALVKMMCGEGAAAVVGACAGVVLVGVGCCGGCRCVDSTPPVGGKGVWRVVKVPFYPLSVNMTGPHRSDQHQSSMTPAIIKITGGTTSSTTSTPHLNPPLPPSTHLYHQQAA